MGTMTTASRSRFLIWGASVVVLLLIANALVAVQHTGSRAGQTYRWVCRESGAELSYTPSAFGSARLAPGRAGLDGACRWELVEPKPLSPLLPWNWLACALDRPAPDPEVIIRQEKLAMR